MFCTNCGKEVGEGFKVCGYCGTPLDGTQGNSSQNSSEQNYGQGYNQQMNNSQMYGQGYNQQMNNGQMYGQGYNQQMNNGQMYGQGYNQQMNNGQLSMANDNKFTILGFFFPGWWLLFKGMWDGFLLWLAITIVASLIALIPVVGLVINGVIYLAMGAFVGSKGNRYARIHKEQGLSFFKIVKNPQLR